jgi:chitodextrinase
MARLAVLAGLTAAVLLSPAPVTAHAAGPVPDAAAPPAVATADGCTTPPQPPANVRASGGFSPTMIILSWTVVPPADGCALAGFDILRAPGATGGVFAKVAQTPVTTSFTDGQLQPATTYRYQVRSRTTNGLVSDPSNTAQATTADACFPQLPFPPMLSVPAVTATSVSLSWFGANPTCVVFDVQRATGATSTTFTVVGTTSSARFTDTTVSPGTTYRYRVRARIVTTGMTWGFTNIVNVTTPGGTASG